MENKNLKEHAFPAMIDIRRREDQEYETIGGFSKHEYAAIMIAQGLAAKFDLEQSGNMKNVARMSYELAAEVLNQFK
jgi:hypothetical protein